MAQHDYIISNQTFPNTRADLNDVLQAIATCNKGSSAPTTQYAGQMWIDDSAGTTWTLYLYDGSDNIQVATIDTTANTINFIDSVVSGFDIVTDTTPQLGGDLDLNSNDITGTGNINITGTATVSGDLTVDTNTLKVDSANNRVGIGISSPSSSLEVLSSSSSTPALKAQNSSGASATTSIFDAVNGGGTLRLRVQNDGAVLVGKTSDAFADEGVVLATTQSNGFTRDDANVMSLRRNTSDGDIVSIYKDTTKMGTIGTVSGELYIGGNQGSRTGLIFGINQITPTQNDGSTADNIRNLGSSTARWKDLYLGGGAVISEATLTDGATISWDVSTKSVAKVTLGGNRTLSAPSNALDEGQFISLLVIQDGTGSRTLTWNAVYEFASDTAPTLTTTGGKGDLFVFRYNGSKWLEVGRNLNLTLS